MLPSYKYKYLSHLYDYAKNLFLIKQFGADKFLVTFTSWVNACMLLEAPRCIKNKLMQALEFGKLARPRFSH